MSLLKLNYFFLLKRRTTKISKQISVFSVPFPLMLAQCHSMASLTAWNCTFLSGSLETGGIWSAGVLFCVVGFFFLSSHKLAGSWTVAAQADSEWAQLFTAPNHFPLGSALILACSPREHLNRQLFFKFPRHFHFFSHLSMSSYFRTEGEKDCAP